MFNLMKNKKYFKFFLATLYYLIIVSLYIFITISVIHTSFNYEIPIKIILISLIIIAFFIMPIYISLYKSPDTKVKEDCKIYKSNDKIIIEYKQFKPYLSQNITLEEIKNIKEFKELENKKISYFNKIYLKSYLIKYYDEIFEKNIINLKDVFKIYNPQKATNVEKTEFIQKRNDELLKTITILGLLIIIAIIPIIIFGLYLIKVFSISYLYLLFILIPILMLISIFIKYYLETLIYKNNELYLKEVYLSDVNISKAGVGIENKNNIDYKIRIKDNDNNILNIWYRINEADYLSKEKEYILYICKTPANKIYTTITNKK